MAILDELEQLNTDEEKYNLIEEYRASGKKISADIIGILKLLESQEIRKKFLKQNIANGEILNVYMLKKIDSQEDRKELLKDYISISGLIDSYMLELIDTQDDREELALEHTKNGGTIDGYTLELIDSQKTREELARRSIAVGGLLDEYMLEKIDSEDVREELAKKYMAHGGYIGIEILRLIESQEGKERLLKQYVQNERNGKRFTNNPKMLEEIESQEKRKEILELYLKNGNLIDETLLCYIDSEEAKKELLKKNIANGGRIDEYRLGLINSPEGKREILEEYLKKKNEENAEDKRYEKYEEMLGTLAKIETSIAKAQNEERKQELIQKREMMHNIINKISLVDETNYTTMLYSRIMAWGEKGVIPPDEIVYGKIPLEKIDEFNIKIWNRLNKAINDENMAYYPPDEIEEIKIALIEMSYVFGLYKADVRVSRGNVQEQGEDNQARMNKVVEYIKSLEDESQLHEIFDGMGMEFNPKFYQFFFENLEAIKENEQLGQDESGEIVLGSLQRELKNIYANIEKIEEAYETGTPTLEQCSKWLIQRQKQLQKIGYENIEEGNSELARLCGLAGVDQENFEEYQMLYETSQKRVTSSIPRIKAEKRRE